VGSRNISEMRIIYIKRDYTSKEIKILLENFSDEIMKESEITKCAVIEE